MLLEEAAYGMEVSLHDFYGKVLLPSPEQPGPPWYQKTKGALDALANARERM